MSVYKRGNKYWIAFRYNRVRYRQCSPENTFAGAKAYEAVLRQKLARGESLDPIHKQNNILYKDFVVDWLERYVKVNNKLSEIRSKKNNLNLYILPFFGSMALDKITNYEIEKFKSLRQKQGLSNKYINNILCTLGKSLRTAEEWGLLDKLPRIKKLKVPPQKFDFLSREESNLLIDSATGQLKDLLTTALHTGLRFGELIALTWGDINLNENILTVSKGISRGYLCSPKSNKMRYVPLNEEVVKVLNRIGTSNNRDKLIFPNTVGKHQIQARCREWLHGLCKRVGLRKIGWHTFRHTFASRLAENGVSMRTIQELLGHSDTNTTMRYAHLSPVVLRQAIQTLEKPTEIKIGHNMATPTVRVPESDVRSYSAIS